MKQPSFDELTRQWGNQTKDFLTLLGDMLTQRLKAKLPIIIGGGILGALSVIFAVFVLTWLSVAGYQSLLNADFSPLVASLITAGGCLFLAALALVILKLQLSRVRSREPDNAAELTEAGRDLLEISKDVAKSTLTPRAILQQNTGRILAGSVIFGLLVGMAVEKPAPEAKR